MECCSPLCAVATASHLAQLDAVETKAFMIIAISTNEAESTDLSLHHLKQVGGLPGFVLLSGYTLCPLHASLNTPSPPGIYRMHVVHQSNTP